MISATTYVGAGASFFQVNIPVLAILLATATKVILPYTLSFAAGAMLYVVFEELIPEANEGKHSNLATIGFAIGFVIMMILDVALG